MRFSAGGVQRWFKTFGSSAGDLIGGVATDEAGTIIVVGKFAGTIDLGTGARTSAGMGDLLIARYDGAGMVQSLDTFGGAADEYASRSVIDSAGRVYTVGSFNGGSTNLGTGTIANAGGYDAFAARYAFGTGYTAELATPIGGAMNEFAFATGVDRAGRSIAVGEFDGSLDLGFGAMTTAGGRDVFVLGLDAAGTPRFVRQFGGANFDSADVAVVLPDDHIVVGGGISGTFDLGTGVQTTANGVGYVVELFPDGTTRSAATIEASNGALISALAVDPSGGFVVAGSFSGTLPLGGMTVDSAGQYAVFIASFR